MSGLTGPTYCQLSLLWTSMDYAVFASFTVSLAKRTGNADIFPCN